MSVFPIILLQEPVTLMNSMVNGLCIYRSSHLFLTLQTLLNSMRISTAVDRRFTSFSAVGYCLISAALEHSAIPNLSCL